MAGGSRRHVVLGLLTDALDATYQTTVLRGAAETAAEHGAGLRCFATGVLRSSMPASAQRNTLLEWVGPHNVDGLIVMAGTLANEVGIEALDSFVARYRPLPICSVGVELPDTFAVLVDNERGVWNAMQHLVEDCGRTRVAFVRGPHVNAEAEHRYYAYLDAVARLGLPSEPSLVVGGDFTHASGVVAAHALLVLEPRPDAVVVADDVMAMGVVDGLLARGVAVPEQVAVVGFNDIEESRFAAVPLTTVRQPLYEQGKRAALALLATLRGDPPLGRIVLPTDLVKRRSSGLHHASLDHGPGVPSHAGVGFEAALAARREAVIAQMRDALTTPMRSGWATWAPRLLDAFTAEILGSAAGQFSATVRDVVAQALRANTDGSSLQDVISIVRREMLLCAGRAHGERARVEALCEQARITIAELVEHAQAHQRLQAQAWARSLGQTITALISTFDVDSLVEAVAEQLPRLGIASCYLSLYREGTERSRAELVLALDVSRPSLRVEGRPQFDTRDLVPPGVLDDSPRTFVVENLFFGEEQLGLVLFELGPREGVIYEALRDQISAALKGALLVKEVLDKDRERQRLMRNLEGRARQLERAYKALQEGQRRMLVSASMTSLVQMSVRSRPLAELYAEVLDQLSSVLGSEHAFIALVVGNERAPVSDTPSITVSEGAPPLSILARSGRLVEGEALDEMLPEVEPAVRQAFGTRRPCEIGHGVALPLVAGEQALGVVFFESEGVSSDDLELLGTFANQATVAINNAHLYQMAAQDPLTEVHARRFFDKWLPREVEASLRSGRPLGLLMVDMDDMKRINDSGGHLAGDRALVAVGRVLRRATRDNDVIARYGGDEFALVLPDSNGEGASSAAGRILTHASTEVIEGVEGPLRCSVGAATLACPLGSVPASLGSVVEAIDPKLLHAMAQRLVSAADESLYEAKSRGGARLGTVRELAWSEPRTAEVAPHKGNNQ